MTMTILITAALIAAYTDLRTRRIPNWLTAGMVMYGLLYSFYRAGWSGLLLSLGGLALGGGLILIPMLIPLAKRGLGAGDIKFLAAVGSIVGAQGVFLVFALATMLGAILSTIALRKSEIRNSKFETNSNDQNLQAVSDFDIRASDFPQGGTPVSIPYGVALSGGTLIVTLGSLVIGHWLLANDK